MELIDKRAAAAMLNVSPRTVERLAAGDASFPAVRFRHTVRFDRDRLETWIASR